MRRFADDLSTTAQVDAPAAGLGGGSLEVLARRLRLLPPNHPSATDSLGRRRFDAGDDVRQEGREGDGGDAPVRSPDSLARDFWSQTGHFEDLWKAHQDRWPRLSSRDRPNVDDMTGSLRGDGKRSLTSIENAQAEKSIVAMQECEPKVTELLRRLEGESPYGAHLVGLEHRLKGPNRLKEKIAEGMTASLGVSVADAADQISDAVRYTYCFEPGSYGRGYADMCARLQAAGCEMLPTKNFWGSDKGYRGINSRWMTPDNDKFEVQFHTSESHYAKEFLTHGSYGRLRSPETSRAERNALYTYQALVCEAIPVPPGVSGMGEMR